MKGTFQGEEIRGRVGRSLICQLPCDADTGKSPLSSRPTPEWSCWSEEKVDRVIQCWEMSERSIRKWCILFILPRRSSILFCIACTNRNYSDSKWPLVGNHCADCDCDWYLIILAVQSTVNSRIFLHPSWPLSMELSSVIAHNGPHAEGGRALTCLIWQNCFLSKYFTSRLNLITENWDTQLYINYKNFSRPDLLSNPTIYFAGK